MKRMHRWGVIGWADVWKTLGSDIPYDEENAGVEQLDGYGVERTIDPGVTYAPPPDIPGVPRWHVKPGSGGRILQMRWHEDREPVTRSLLDLQAAVSGRRKSLTADDVDLAAIDASIDLLVSAAESLHAADRSLGFLQPDSCRVGTSLDGSLYVTLPDVGFAWDKRLGLMIPRWVAEPELELLFEEGAVLRNEACLAEVARARHDDRYVHAGATDASVREVADVKILARLIAAALVGVEEVRRWCGGKKFLSRLPSKDVARDTQADIWDNVIAPALDGQIKTCQELRLRLESQRPSSHFLHVPPAPPWGGWRVMRRAAVVAAAACGLALMWMMSDDVAKWLAGDPAPFCRVVPKSNPLYAQLFSLKQSQDRARGDVAARVDYWALLQECLPLHADPQTCGGTCLSGLVDEWLLQTEEEGQAVRERLRTRPEPTREEVRNIATAIASIQQAEQYAKRAVEKSVVPVLQRELRLRGGKVTAPVLERP